MEFEMRSEPGGLMGGLLQPRGTALKQPTAPPRGQGAAALPAFVQRGRAAPLRARRTRRAGQQQRQCASATASVTAAAAASAPPVALHSRQLQQFVCGGLAGTVTKTLVAPLERISTIMAVSRRASMGQAVQAALQDGGAAGLWRGNWATVLKIFPASAIQFSVFHSLKDAILTSRGGSSTTSAGGAAATTNAPAPQLHVGDRLLAGAAAGAASVVVTYPLESLRTLMSVAGGMRGSLLQVAGRVVASQGAAGLYRGFQACLIGDMLGNALGFSLFEVGCRIYQESHGGGHVSPTMRGLVGGLSAALTMTATMPLEVVRRRLQVQGALAGQPVLYRGTLDCFRRILREEGLLAFYSASLPQYLKVAPSIGAMYALYDVLSRRWPSAVAAPPVAQTAQAARGMAD